MFTQGKKTWNRNYDYLMHKSIRSSSGQFVKHFLRNRMGHLAFKLVKNCGFLLEKSSIKNYLWWENLSECFLKFYLNLSAFAAFLDRRQSNSKKFQKKKHQWVHLRVLTKAVCENIFSTIENRVLRFSFIYKIEI